MSSLMTNSQAMTALQTLRSVDANSFHPRMNRISTGYRVSTASDNAAYWSIATTMRSDVQALGAVQDALGLARCDHRHDVYRPRRATVDVVSAIKAKLVAARTPGVDRAKIQSEITEPQKQLKNTADLRRVQAVRTGSRVDSGQPQLQRNQVRRRRRSPRARRRRFGLTRSPVDLNAIKLYDTTLDAAYITAHAAATTTTLVFDPATVGDAAAVPPTTTGTIAFAVTPAGGTATTTTINVSQINDSGRRQGHLTAWASKALLLVSMPMARRSRSRTAARPRSPPPTPMAARPAVPSRCSQRLRLVKVPRRAFWTRPTTSIIRPTVSPPTTWKAQRRQG